MRAPLRAAVFAIELTGRLDFLPATIATAVASYAVAVLVLRRSILTENISRRGRHIFQEYAVDPLAMTLLSAIMTPDPETLPAAMPLADAVRFFSDQARHRTYPVVNTAQQPVGLVSRSDELRWQVTELPEDASPSELLSDRSMALVFPDMPSVPVAEDIGRIPAIDRASGRIVGSVAPRSVTGSGRPASRGEGPGTLWPPEGSSVTRRHYRCPPRCG